MITIYYLLDKRIAYKASKQVPLLADVKYQHNNQSEHFRFSTGIKCNPKLFQDQQIRSAEPNAESKNQRLRRIKSIAQGIYLEGMNSGKLPDLETSRSESSRN